MNASAFFGCPAPFGDRHRVDPRERTRRRDDVLDLLVVGLDREHVARVRLSHQQLAALERVLVVGGDLLHLLLQVDQVLLGRVEVAGVERVRVLLQREQGHRERVPGFVEERALARHRRKVERVPVGDRSADLRLVEADAGGSPLPRDRVCVAGVVRGGAEPGVEVLHVRDEREVERLDEVRVLHLHERGVGRER